MMSLRGRGSGALLPLVGAECCQSLRAIEIGSSFLCGYALKDFDRLPCKYTFFMTVSSALPSTKLSCNGTSTMMLNSRATASAMITGSDSNGRKGTKQRWKCYACRAYDSGVASTHCEVYQEIYNQDI